MTKHIHFPLVLLFGMHMMYADHSLSSINSLGSIDPREHCVMKSSSNWTAVGVIASCCAFGYNLLTTKDIHWILRNLMIVTPLALCALKDRADAQFYATAHGCDLHAAAAKNDVDAISLLTDAGYEILKTDARKRTPFMYAAAAGAEQALDALFAMMPLTIPIPAQYAAYEKSIDRGNGRFIGFAVRTEIPCVDMVDIYGRTAAHYAVLNGHQEVLKKLVHDYSASINIPDNNGKTVRMLIQYNPTLHKMWSDMLLHK